MAKKEHAPDPASAGAWESRRSVEDVTSAKTLKESRQHLDMLHGKQGDAEAHIEKARDAIAESRKVIADDDHAIRSKATRRLAGGQPNTDTIGASDQTMKPADNAEHEAEGAALKAELERGKD